MGNKVNKLKYYKENRFSSLPQGWVWTRLGEILEPSKEKADPTKLQKLPYIGLEHIEKDTGRLLNHGYSDEVRSTKTKFYKGDLLYGKLRPYLNKVYLADFEGICSTDILVFPENHHISNKYLLYRLLCNDFVRYASLKVSGVQHPRVNFKILSQFLIPLPPLPEQHRIVAKIEELFTRLDAGVEALKKIKAQIKRYRQAVLKYAFEGKLTEQWRKANKDRLEHASILLERIKEERQKNLQKKYKELPSVDTSDLPQLPEGWVWTRVGEIYDIVGGGTPSTKIKEYWEGDIPWITSADIHGLKDIRPRRKITKEAIANSATNLVPEESLIVVTRVGLGKVALTKIPLCFSQDSQALIGNSSCIYPNYSLYYLSQAVQIFKYKHRGTTIAGVTKKQLSELTFALPPFPEQQKIVEEIERRFSVADEVEKVVDQSLKQAERLKQSILKKAFEGKLVPQDPSDEPAEKLLERIKAEKTKLTNNATKRSKLHGQKTRRVV
jgi:type I restriction enzyme S subunit